MYCKNCNSDIGEFRYCSQCGADNADYIKNCQSNDEDVVAEDVHRGKAIASLVLSIFSMTGLGSYITPILAIAFSGYYLKHGNGASKSIAKAGRVLGIISLIVSLVIAIVVSVLFCQYFIWVLQEMGKSTSGG